MCVARIQIRRMTAKFLEQEGVRTAGTSAKRPTLVLWL